MSKKIGITCDNYKTEIFRKGLLKEGYVLEFDGDSGINGMHLFRIEVSDAEFEKTKTSLSKTLKQLELRVKRAN